MNCRNWPRFSSMLARKRKPSRRPKKRRNCLNSTTEILIKASKKWGSLRYLWASIVWCPIPYILNHNSLAPGRCRCDLKLVIFKLIPRIHIWSIFCEIALRWMPQDLTSDKSTLVQVMAWCRQATSHYLSLCWPRFMSPYGLTRLQWVNHGLDLIHRFWPEKLWYISNIICNEIKSHQYVSCFFMQNPYHVMFTQQSNWSTVTPV